MLLVLVGCGDGAGHEPVVPPASAAVTSAAASAEIAAVAAPILEPCGLEASEVCLDAATRIVCSGGTATVERCEGTTACSAGRCAELGVPPARLRVPGRASYWNAWSGFVGIGPKTRDELLASGDLSKVGDAKSAKAICGADGWVAPRKKGDSDDARAAAVLAATLISDRAQQLELRVGVSGHLDLRVGETTLRFDELPGREGRALPDERFVLVDVPAGKVEVTAALTPDTGGFYLRARQPGSGALPTGVALMERFEAAACKPGALLVSEAELGLEADGFHLRAAPRFGGLVPLLGEEKLTIAAAGAKPGFEAALELDRLALARGPAKRVDQRVELPEKGGARIRAAFGDVTLFERALPDGKALVPRATALLAAQAKIDADGALPQGSRDSFAYHVGEIAAALARAESDRGFVEAMIKEGEALAEKLLAHEDAYATKRGVVRRALRSPLDLRLSPYVTYVPPSLDRLVAKGKRAPLVLIAHGRDRLPEHALRTLIGEAPDEHMTLAFAAHHLPGFPDQGAILAAPMQFGNGGTQPPGEQDLLGVIDALSQAYPVDAQRVALTGYSLGGTISFAAPLHFPDRFAASAPLCGYPNLLDYQSVSRVPHLPFEEALLEKEYIVRYAENGLHVPLRIVHGGQDGPGRSKVVADRYKALGQSAIFDIQEDLDHNVWDYAYEDSKMVPWLTGRSAPTAPARVRFSTGKYRYDRAYWLRLVKLVDAGKKERAEVDARWDAKAKSFAIDTKQVAALELDLARLGVAEGERVTVTIDGDSLEAAAIPKLLLSRRADGHFEVTKELPAGGKEHGSSGPIDDVLHGPLTIVVGTRGAGDREANRLLAEQLSTLGGSADVRYPVIEDREASDAQLAGRHLVLVGSPRSNALTERLAPMLPVKFHERGLELRGERFESDDVGVALIFPGPEAIEGDGLTKRSRTRYVVLYAGVTPRATLAARMLPRYLPDFVIYGRELATQRGGLLMDQRKVLSAGFFSEGWE